MFSGVQVAQILCSPTAQKIDFHLAGIHVDGAGLRDVAAAVLSGVAQVGGIRIALEAQPAGTAARYKGGENVLSFSPTIDATSASDRVDIIHECVHAMQDIWGGRLYSPRGSLFTTEVENEAAAYVAGALYSLYDTGQIYTGGPHDMAFVVARSIRGRKGAFVDRGLAKGLQLLIALHPVYMGSGVTLLTPTYANGI